MCELTYRLPEVTDRDLLSAYVREHLAKGEPGVSASLGLPSSDFAEWVETIRGNALTGSEPWGRSLLYLCLDGDRLVGLLSIQYELPPNLSEIFGDIGYGVRPSERNRGYAGEMLRHALSVCREKGKDRVILVCFRDNPASEAVSRKNGGVLIAESDRYQEGRISRHYEIRLQPAPGPTEEIKA